MANDPPFATLNHVAGDLGIPSESALLRIGISRATGKPASRGEQVDFNEHATLSSTLVRLAAKIGIDRVPKDVTPNLQDYLASYDAAQHQDVAAGETPTGEARTGAGGHRGNGADGGDVA
jgi:hypothetical protein